MADHSKSRELEKLKGEAKQVVDGVLLGNANASSSSSSTDQKLLCLIGAVCRLGIAHHFKQELHQAFQRLLPSAAASRHLDLLHTALLFRLLRQHAMPVTPVVFDKFLDMNGKFPEHLAEDTEGLLSLYEASWLGFCGEQVLKEAKGFSYKHLMMRMKYLCDDDENNKLKGNLHQQVQLSLQIPLHLRMSRVEARTFIDLYQQDHGGDSVLLRLAKLEYNLSQALYLDELQQLTKWWRGVKGKHNNKLEFARDRLVECYFWAMGSVPEREFSKGRKNLAGYACLATVLDDIYDVHGSLDDLYKFTQAVNQWDIEAANELPDYMKVFYAAMVENGEQTVRDASEHLHPMIDFMPYIQEQWASYCRVLLVEAKWSRQRYRPTFDEYKTNAWVSIGIVAGLVYAILAQADSLAQYLPGCIEDWAHSELFYWPSLITRLHDDLTSTEDEMERGEPNAVVCYMMDHGVDQEEAQAHMRDLLNESWMRLIQLVGHIPSPLVDVAINMARSVERIYHHGDWFGDPTQLNQDCITHNLLNPIP